MLGIVRNVSMKNCGASIPLSIRIGIKANGKNINGYAIIAALFKPYMFTSVFVPVFLSASESMISFVIEPPIKKTIAINPIVRGKVSKAFPNTLQLASIPRSPLGIPIHS